MFCDLLPGRSGMQLVALGDILRLVLCALQFWEPVVVVVPHMLEDGLPCAVFP